MAVTNVVKSRSRADVMIKDHDRSLDRNIKQSEDMLEIKVSDALTTDEKKLRRILISLLPLVVEK